MALLVADRLATEPFADSAGRRKGHRGPAYLWFAARTGLWLGLAVLLLPRPTSQAQVAVFDGLSAAMTAISEMRQFCSGQVSACEAGSQATIQIGRETKRSVNALAEFLKKQAEVRDNTERTRRSQNTLTPADMEAPWRRPRTGRRTSFLPESTGRIRATSRAIL